AREGRDSAGQLAGEREQVLEGNVFAEGNEVDLVVAANHLAAGVNDERGVVVVPSVLRLREIRADAADHERRLRGEGDRAHGLLEAEVILNERRGRFGPDDEVGMGRIWRANNFARRRARLRNSGDVRLALLAGQTRKFGDMSIPLRTLPVVARAH